MSTLYTIGGSARSGKTTTLNMIMERHPIMAISFDAVREGMRNALIGESYISATSISFEGKATFHRPGEKSDITHTEQFSQETNQDDLAWKTMEGIIAFYDRKNISLAIEGASITPERIKKLNLKNLILRPVFVGFMNESYLDTILEQSNIKKDWIYRWIQENNGDDTVVRNWFDNQLQENYLIAQQAKEYGYHFFEIKENNFEENCKAMAKYLLSQ